MNGKIQKNRTDYYGISIVEDLSDKYFDEKKIAFAHRGVKRKELKKEDQDRFRDESDE